MQFTCLEQMFDLLKMEEQIELSTIYLCRRLLTLRAIAQMNQTPTVNQGSVLQPASSYSAYPGWVPGADWQDVPTLATAVRGGVQNDLVNSGHQTSWVFHCFKSPACQALSINGHTQPWRSWEQELSFIPCFMGSALAPPAAFRWSCLAAAGSSPGKVLGKKAAELPWRS